MSTDIHRKAHTVQCLFFSVKHRIYLVQYMDQRSNKPDEEYGGMVVSGRSIRKTARKTKKREMEETVTSDHVCCERGSTFWPFCSVNDSAPFTPNRRHSILVFPKVMVLYSIVMGLFINHCTSFSLKHTLSVRLSTCWSTWACPAASLLY